MKPVRLLCYLFLWTWRCTALSNVAIILILSGSSKKIIKCTGIGFFFLKAKREKSRTAQKQWVRLAKQLLCTCITLFYTFPCRHCTTTMWKCLDFTFRRGREHKTTTFFFFSWTLIQYFRTQLQRKCQILTNSTRWNKRDKGWSRATSLFRCRFRSRRSRCCWSFHLLGTFSIDDGDSSKNVTFKLKWIPVFQTLSRLFQFA